MKEQSTMSPGVSTNPSRLAAAARALPAAVIFFGLGGLAYWGHVSEWKLPKFSALWSGAGQVAESWCAEHNVPEDVCVECTPGLLPPGQDPGWCKLHGVPECPLDHPELAQVKGQPKLPKYDILGALALRDRPENNSRCTLHRRRIQFASAAAAEKAGVDIGLVEEMPMTEAIVANGEIGYDQTKVARLSSRVPGMVSWVTKKVGDAVEEGEILALVDAAEVGRAKAEFLQALVQFRLRSKTYDSLLRAAGSGAVPERQLREAETGVSESRIRLLSARQALINLGFAVGEELKELPEDQLAAQIQFLGIPQPLLERLDSSRRTGNLIAIKTPLEGVVVTREVVAGEIVDSAKALFMVADPRRMWLSLHVKMEDAKYLALGQAVRFRSDASAADVAGTISWISPAVDERTRTVKVRAELANQNGRLLANTFGSGRIILREEKYAVVVPKEAVHWDGDCQVVFVRDKNYLDEKSPKVFHVRKVRTGAQDEHYIEILAGLLPGEVIAVKGSAVLQAELLKSQLGES